MDLSIKETGDGADVIFDADLADIEITESFYNQIYLCMFGGNTAASTTDEEEQPEQRFDWWGNAFLDENSRMNSLTEKALRENALDSKGLNVIETQAKKDLEVMETFGDVSVSVSMIGNDKVRIDVKISQPNTINVNIYSYIWDANKSEVITEETI
jgi:hypothetical protein